MANKWKAGNYMNSGMSKEAYLKKYPAKKSSSSSSKSSSKDEKKATDKIKKYYKENESTVKEKAKTDVKRLQQDLQNVMRDSGISQTRATEDYIRNIGNIEANKSADVSDLNDYVRVNTGRTQEDLDTSLFKEERRYALEYDKINEDLASRGLTFSERKPEQIARDTSAIAKTDIAREAGRSFQDIARYEAAKNRDIELKYGQQTEVAKTNKERSLEDILNDQQDAARRNQRAQEDVAFGKTQDIRDISYGRDTDVALVGQKFDEMELNQQDRENRISVLGY